MKLKEALELIGGKLVCGDPDATVSGVYTCDLLSRAMARLEESDLWITIQNNVNTVAVASLVEAGAVVFPEGIEPGEDVVKTAEDKGINIAKTDKTAFEICKELGKYI